MKINITPLELYTLLRTDNYGRYISKEAIDIIDDYRGPEYEYKVSDFFNKFQEYTLNEICKLLKLNFNNYNSINNVLRAIETNRFIVLGITRNNTVVISS